MPKKNVILLGSTGAIGGMCLDVLKASSEYQIVAITAYTNKKELEKIQHDFNVPHSFLVNAKNKAEGLSIANFLIDKYNKSDTIVINAVQGSGGLNFSEYFACAGFDLYLANKETVVCGGREFMKMAEEKGSQIIPLDTEMVALSHLVTSFGKENIDEFIITASGGPFFNYTSKELKNITYKEATKHPVWKMGKEISVDSATLLNKALEIVEAAVLFDIPPKQIKVLFQKESYVHSLVRLKNGMLYAELYTPDQRVALSDALGIKRKAEPRTSIPTLHFNEAKNITALELGYEAALSNKKAKALVEGKEEAYIRFKNGEIQFNKIVAFVQNHMKAIE